MIGAFIVGFILGGAVMVVILAAIIVGGDR